MLQRSLFDAIAAHRYTSVVVAACCLIGVTAMVRYMAYRSSLIAQQITNDAIERLVIRLVEHFYNIDYRSITSRDYGYYMARVYDEPVDLVQKTLSATTSLLTAIATSAGALAVCLWLSWKLTVGLICIMPLAVYLSRRSRERMASIFVTTSEHNATLRDGLGHVLRAYVTVNMYDLGSAVRTAVQTLLRSWETNLLRRTKYIAMFQGATSALFSFAELAVLLGGVLTVMAGQMTIGGLMAFLVAYTRVMRSFELIGSQLPAFASVNAGLARLEEFLALGEERGVTDGAEIMALRDASFGYSTTEILRGLSLSVNIGQRLLISGPNGCGKSTLVYILAGFLHAKPDDQSIPTRQRISALLLPFVFIPGSVKDNVSFSSMSEAKSRRFLQWAESLELLDKLDRDPSSLSQGEQRKVQVIMTLLKDATYYLFDEPLSHVDRASEDVVMNLIFDETKEAGLLVIMHGGDKYHDAFDAFINLDNHVLQAA